MKKSFIFGAALACALGFQSCSDVDNPVPTSEPLVAEIKAGTDLAVLVDKYAVDGVLTLPAGAEVTLAEALEASEPLTIVGDEAKPAKIIAKGGFVVADGLTLTNVEIDPTELQTALITTPTGDLAEWITTEINLTNVTIKGLTKSLFVSAGKNYHYKNFVIDNSIIEFNETAGLEFDFRKGGVAENFTIKNSTLYAVAATGNSLYTSQSAQRGTEAPGVTLQTFTIENSTLVNFAKTKNFFTHRQANQTWLGYTLKNSIFVNCGKSGQVVKGINQGQNGKNPVWNIDGNVFNFDGAEGLVDSSAEEATGDDDEPVKNTIAVVVDFADAAKGDFTQTVAKAGDPRWIK